MGRFGRRIQYEFEQRIIRHGVLLLELYIQVMKQFALPLLCAIGFVVLASSAQAAAVDDANPYAGTITNRNVFSLKDPPPPPKPEDLIKKDPPPKILLQGLTTILGRRQVLFKVLMPAKPGQPAKEESFVSAEGERNGEIEVLEIDEVAGVVKFNNHGTIEPKNMKDDVAKATAAAPPPGPQPPGVPPPAIPSLPRPTAAANPASSGPSIATTFGGSQPHTIPTRTLRTSSATGANVPVGTYNAGQSPHPTQTGTPLSREEQEVLIEVNRQRYLDEGNPQGRILPPTSLSPQRQAENAP
jgi:hypothetical protein